jgi:glycosyltransferase involved in cell wall biosynthesis
MRVLFITPCLPFPPYRDSVRLRSYYLLRHLAEDCEIHLVSPISGDDESQLAESLKGFCCRSIITAPVRAAKSRQAKRASSLRATPQRCNLLDHSFLELLESARRRLKPDLIHAHTMLTAGYALKIDGLPRVLDLVDSDALYHLKNRRFARSVRMRLRSMVRYSQFEKLERERLPRFELVTVTSPEDSAFIRGLAPGTRLEVIPNGVDLDYFTGSKKEHVQAHTIGIVGAFDSYENYDGARFFIRRVYPSLRKRFPDLGLRLIGRDPESRIEALTGPGISVTGEIDDIRPPMQECSVIVSPVRLGSGVKNSVLQALSMGKPVVATSQATRALAGTEGEHYLTADSASEMRAAIARLLDDLALRHDIGAKARAFVKQDHTWEKGASSFLDAYERLIEDHRRKKSSMALI